MGTTTTLEIANGRGHKLAAVLHGELGPALVVSCHGMLSNKNGPKHLLLSEELAQRGVASLRFDFAGCGESEGALFDMTYSSEMQDLEAVITFLAKSGVERFGLFGSSMGGAVALLAAARDERIVAIATLAAVGSLSDMAERYPHEVASFHQQGYIETVEGRIGRGLYDDAMTHDVLAAVRILRAPLCIVHGEEDEVIPSADAHDIASIAKNATLELVPGADHQFTRPEHLRPAMRKIADFLAEQLS